MSFCPGGIISLTLLPSPRQDPEDKAGGPGSVQECIWGEGRCELFAPEQNPQVSRPGGGAGGKTRTELGGGGFGEQAALGLAAALSLNVLGSGVWETLGQ